MYYYIMTTLFDVLNNGYKDKKKKSKNLGGYVMDEQLSNKHYQTYYDPKDKKKYCLISLELDLLHQIG